MTKFIGNVRGELLRVVEVTDPHRGRVGQIIVVWLSEECRIDEENLVEQPEASA